MTDWLRKNLEEVFALPSAAVEWLLSLYRIIQVFDDIADGDPVSRDDLNAVIWDCLVGRLQNEFFARHANQLIPVIATAIIKWQASDTMERQGLADARSFVWRASYYDVVVMVVSICHGPTAATKNAHLILQLYGEKLDDYLAEFQHA